MLLSQELGRAGSRTQRPMSILQIRDVDPLFVQPRLALAEAYLLKGLPLNICRRNLAIAERLGYPSHVRGWQLLEAMLTPTPTQAAGSVRLAARVLEEQQARNRTSMAQLNTLCVSLPALVLDI